MRFFKKFAGLFAAALILLPSLGQAYTINGNLDVRGNIIGGMPPIGETNLNLSLSAGTLTINCMGQTGGIATCSSSNPGWVTIGHNTAGQAKVYKITGNFTFDDDSATDSDFQGTGTCSWGTTAATAWGDNAPIFLGFMSDGTTPVAVLGRLPVTTSGASTNIGYKDVCPSVANQSNVIAITAFNITSSHANQPITWIGVVRATKSSADDWTFASLDSGDGIGDYAELFGRPFRFPTGQMGAAASTHIRANGGTAPIWTNNNDWYVIKPGGWIENYIDLNGDGGTDGAGAVTTQIATPFTCVTPVASMIIHNDAGLVQGITTINNASFLGAELVDGTSFLTARYVSATPGLGFVQNAMFSNGARIIQGTVLFPAMGR